jgi:DNA-binding LacI/PurR family transcriptional regulator
VLINSGADDSWSRVNVNDLQGGMSAMRHLLEQGHRRIAYYAGLAMLNHPSATLRYDAYRRCMSQAGLEPMSPFIGTPDAMVAQLLKPGSPDAPTAIMDFEHWSAIRLLQALWRAGLRVPDDVSVITFNDTHPVADVIPPLTTVALPGRKMAEIAVQLLMKQLDEEGAAVETVTLDEALVVRESTAAPAE